MAVVKANYVKRGKGEKGRAKATIRYITHRRDRDGKKTTRTLFGFDGVLTKEQVYHMIDEAKRGTIFYRFILSPDPAKEDSYKDLDLTNLTLDTILALEERIGKQVQFAAVLHDDHSNHRHAHLLVLVHGRRLTREDFKALRLEATTQALSQRQALDLFRGQEAGQAMRQGRGHTGRSRGPQTHSRTFPLADLAAPSPFTERPCKAYACPLCHTHLVLPESSKHRCPSCGIKMRSVSGAERYQALGKEGGLGLSLLP